MNKPTAVERVRGVLKAIDVWSRIGIPGPCDPEETKAALETFEKMAGEHACIKTLQKEEWRLIQEMQKLRVQLVKREDALRGLSWMLGEGALVRDCSHDSEPDYMARSLEFGRWLARIFASLYEKKGE